MAPLLLDNVLLLIKLRNQCNHKTIVVVSWIGVLRASNSTSKPYHSITRLTQSKLRSSHVHRGHGHPWTSNKNRAELGGGLAAVNP